MDEIETILAKYNENYIHTSLGSAKELNTFDFGQRGFDYIVCPVQAMRVALIAQTRVLHSELAPNVEDVDALLGTPERAQIKLGHVVLTEVAPLFCTAFQPAISGFTGGVRPLSELRVA